MYLSGQWLVGEDMREDIKHTQIGLCAVIVHYNIFERWLGIQYGHLRRKIILTLIA